MDPETIMFAVGAVKGAVTGIGDLRKLLNDRKVKPQQVNDLILQIQNSLLDAQASLLQSHSQAATLTADIRSLKQQLADLQDLKENYEFRDNAYWRKGTGEGPFCQPCLDADKKVVRLQDHGYSWFCDVHQRAYLTQAQRERADELTRRSTSSGGWQG